MQNNYRQGRESYTTGVGSSRYYLNSSRETSLDEKLLKLNLRESELLIPNIPEIECLMEVHSTGYKQILLDKMLDCNRIVNHPFLQEGSSEGVSGTLGNSMNQPQQLDFSRLSDKDLAVIKDYECGVGLLELGYEKYAKENFKKAADGRFLHAGYVYAMMTFKEIVQHEMGNESKLPRKKDINKAVQYMIDVKEEFFPFPSFVLGMMRSNTLFDKIFVNQKLTVQVTSARECFQDVLSGIGYSEGKYSLTVPRKYIVVEDESDEYLKWVDQSTKYELARGMLSCPEGRSDARSLLQELSAGGFVDAKYLYALALLKGTFGDAQTFEKENFGQAYALLEEAVNHGHKEAMFFFGTLPFRQEFKILDKESQSYKGSCCFGYLRKYIDTCGKDGKFKKDAAILIAAEYVKEKSSYVTYNEERAKNVLRANDCLDELQQLERKLHERAYTVLPNVLRALEQVHSELKKNGEQSAQQLSSKVKELLDALQSSGLFIQQSPRLTPLLKLLHILSTGEQHFLLPALQLLYYVLESQVDSQSHKEVFSPLQSLFLTCFKLEMEHSHTWNMEGIPSQDFNPNKPSTTLQMGHGCISPVSEQGFNPKSSSTMKGDEDVAGNSAFDTVLGDKSITRIPSLGEKKLQECKEKILLVKVESR